MAKATQDVIVRIKVDGAGNAKVQIDQLGKSFLDAEVAAKKMTDEIADGSKIAEGSVAHYRRMITAMKIVRDNSAKTAEDFQRQTLAIEKLQVEMREITSSTKSYNKVNEKQISNAGLAGATLTEFGRTISDLPYGIRGVANNLSQLSTLFITLMSKTKGFTNTIKLLKAELMGPLGFILAFQAVISLLDFFAGKTDKAKESTDELTESINQELVVLRELNDAISENIIKREDAEQVAKSVLKTNKELKKIIEDTTLSEEQREEAITELLKKRQKELELEDKISSVRKKISEDSIRLDKINNDIATKKNELNAVDASNSVLRAIKQDELNALGVERNKIIKEQVDDLTELVSLSKQQNELDSESIDNNEDLIQVGTIEYYEELIKELREVQRESVTTSEQYKDIQKEIDLFQAKIDKITGSTKKLTKANKKQKESFDELIGVSGGFYSELYRQSQKLNDDVAGLSRQRRQIEFLDIKTVLAEDIAALKQRSSTRVGFERGKERLIKESLEKEIKAIKFALENDRLTIGERLKLRQRLANATTQLAESEAQKYIDAAKQAIAVYETFKQAGDLLFEAEISREERKTVLINNQLRKRLDNEKLTVKQRDSLNNQISANEENLARKRDKIAEKQFKIQKALAMGEAIITAFISASRAREAVLAGPEKFLGIAALPLSKIAYGIVLASGLATAAAIGRQQFVPSAIGGGGASGAGGAGGGANVQAPDFNVVGSTAQSQLAETIAGAESKPTRAYVVGKDITTQQELDRNRRRTSA